MLWEDWIHKPQLLRVKSSTNEKSSFTDNKYCRIILSQCRLVSTDPNAVNSHSGKIFEYRTCDLINRTFDINRAGGFSKDTYISHCYPETITRVIPKNGSGFMVTKYDWSVPSRIPNKLSCSIQTISCQPSYPSQLRPSSQTPNGHECNIHCLNTPPRIPDRH